MFTKLREFLAAIMRRFRVKKTDTTEFLTPQHFTPETLPPQSKPLFTDPPRATRNGKFSREEIQKHYSEIAANVEGVSFRRPAFDAPDGWFWEQDKGALDGIGLQRWRIYRKKVQP